MTDIWLPYFLGFLAGSVTSAYKQRRSVWAWEEKAPCPLQQWWVLVLGSLAQSWQWELLPTTWGWAPCPLFSFPPGTSPRHTFLMIPTRLLLSFHCIRRAVDAFKRLRLLKDHLRQSWKQSFIKSCMMWLNFLNALWVKEVGLRGYIFMYE